MVEEIRFFIDSIGATKLQSGNEIHKIISPIFKRQNYFYFRGQVIIVKISRIDPPFFGVNERYINMLSTLKKDYSLILLTSKKTGWYYSCKTIKQEIDNGNWGYSSKDKNYKIKNYYRDEFNFKSISEFLALFDDYAKINIR